MSVYEVWRVKYNASCCHAIVFGRHVCEHQAAAARGADNTRRLVLKSMYVLAGGVTMREPTCARVGVGDDPEDRLAAMSIADLTPKKARLRAQRKQR